MAISLASIARGTRMKAPKVVLYGTAGVGKTAFAANAPSPVFLCTEEGLGALNVARIEPREGDPLIRSWSEIMESLQALQNEDHDFRTVVVDSLDFMEPLLWEHTAQKHDKEDIEAFGYGKGYMYAVEEARAFLDALDQLRNTKGMAIVLICHDEVVRHESPDHEAFDRYQLRLQKRLAHKVRDWSDCLLFANYRTHVVTDKGKFNNERSRAIGKGERVLHTEERPAFWAKNRYSLPAELPLSWQAFQDAITASAQAASQATQESEASDTNTNQPQPPSKKQQQHKETA